MTPEEQQIIKELSNCTFLPGSYTKRFVRSMCAMIAATDDPQLTLKQRRFLYKLRWMFRKQIWGFYAKRFIDPPDILKPDDVEVQS